MEILYYVPNIFWKYKTISETKKPKPKANKPFYFQVGESPTPLNILTPTPAPDHVLGGHKEAESFGESGSSSVGYMREWVHKELE